MCLMVSVPTRGLLIPNLDGGYYEKRGLVSVPTRGLLIPNQLMKNDNAVDEKVSVPTRGLLIPNKRL